MTKIFKTPKLQLWIVPLVLSGGLFMLVRPTLAQIAEPNPLFSDYIASHELTVGQENLNGYTLVYYEYEGEKKHISEENQNAYNPHQKGRYIVYTGEVGGIAQVFRYDLLAGYRMQITTSGTNANPHVSRNGWVVWEGWVAAEDRWQIFRFDGVSIEQLTSGDLSLNPVIEDETIIFSRKDPQGVWRAQLYDHTDRSTEDITFGEEARAIGLKEGKIKLADGQDYALDVKAISVLEYFDNLRREELQTVDREEIEQEIETAAPDIDLGAMQPQESTPSASPEPTGTDGLAF